MNAYVTDISSKLHSETPDSKSGHRPRLCGSASAWLALDAATAKASAIPPGGLAPAPGPAGTPPRNRAPRFLPGSAPHRGARWLAGVKNFFKTVRARGAE